jgi:hypothetical protein
MTSKYAILSCKLEYRSADQGPIEQLRKEIVARYETPPQEKDKRRWRKLANRIYSVVELDGLTTEDGSFNGFL